MCKNKLSSTKDESQTSMYFRKFVLALILSICNSCNFIWLWIFVGLGFVPLVSAESEYSAFPEIAFDTFSNWVSTHFDKNVSLATVLTVFFTITSNPDLLNLHARQQHPKIQGELRHLTTGWMKGLARTLQIRLQDEANTLLSQSDKRMTLTEDQITSSISVKIESLAKILKLYPYNSHNRFKGKLKAVSMKAIEPVYILCPKSTECETKDCQIVISKFGVLVSILIFCKIYMRIP